METLFSFTVPTTPRTFQPQRATRKANKKYTATKSNIETMLLREGESMIPEFELTMTGRAVITNKRKILTSRDIAEVLRAIFADGTMNFQEHFYICTMNQRNDITGIFLISKGGITGTVADPRIILQAALMMGAVSVVLCHNHPSGNLKPSQVDIDLTRKIKSAFCYVDIKVIDHIILSSEDYYSFADEGIL